MYSYYNDNNNFCINNSYYYNTYLIRFLLYKEINGKFMKNAEKDFMGGSLNEQQYKMLQSVRLMQQNQSKVISLKYIFISIFILNNNYYI